MDPFWPSIILINLSYILLISLSLFRRLMTIRILGAAAGFAAAGYGIVVGDWSIIAWETVFGAINSVQVARLVRESRGVHLTDSERELQQAVFWKMSMPHFQRLLRAGAWVEAGERTELTREGRPVSHIALIAAGMAAVVQDGKRVATCHRGDFIGEMAYLSGNPASATVVAETPLRYILWTFEELGNLIEGDPEIRRGLEGALSENLIEKLMRHHASDGTTGP
ncbi:MAG: cyclic nucleotide-binding domain-containing protein [Akkermansiaceae bacterium]|nr:cyclic nucleotide-binding domain-containing protein [Akkermansiaceae bacterium]NNM28605.1 cyclic nucleotide-binding domain-containing protein [Akkermansiaceae bacterium]